MSLYALFGLALFFALGFGAGVGWACRRLVPEPTSDVREPAVPSGRSPFRDDLIEGLKDPEFRRAYDETSAEIRAYDARMNGEDPT